MELLQLLMMAVLNTDIVKEVKRDPLFLLSIKCPIMSNEKY